VNQSNKKLEESLLHLLFKEYGPMVTGVDLVKVLGYPSDNAFRQSISRKTVPVEIFDIPNRKGKFALVTEIASWLAAQKQNSK